MADRSNSISIAQYRTPHEGQVDSYLLGLYPGRYPVVLLVGAAGLCTKMMHGHFWFGLGPVLEERVQTTEFNRVVCALQGG